MKYNYLFPQLKRDCLIIDIETSASFANGGEISITSQFDKYIECAQIKWFGAYSYARNAYYILDAKKNKGFIINLLNIHNTIIGFNSQEFDYPILKNNGYIINERKRPVHIDCMQILGKSAFYNKDGYAYKNRGELMDCKFKNNSLKTMAEEMKLDFQKGDIDYHIFQKDAWTPEEEMQIKTYLKNDILITKQMFEKLWNFWVPFTELLNIKYVRDFSWIRNSIAALTYKAACSYLRIEPTYSEEVRKEEKMGGNVLLPKYEEARNVWYVDFASLYPHLLCMFNLLAEKDSKENPRLWHGNEMFQVRGYYDISKPHPLNMYIQKKLSERIQLKRVDKNNPMIYTLKILCNSLYGIVRSPIFEKIHTPNAGWDTCYLGQQVQGYVSKRMLEFGFESIAGDTDSLFLLTNDEVKNKRDYVRECLTIIVKEINKNTPFPIGTFDINIESFIDYIMFPFSEEPIKDEEGNNIKEKNKLVKELKGRKKNYCYIHQNGDKKEVVLVGLPIIKDNATSLGIKIFTEVLEPLILKQMHAKFSYDFIKETINTYLKQDEILTLIAQEYKIKSLSTYKLESQIQAQISKAYFNGREGIISLIKNKKVGKVGKETRYCSIEEAKEAKLTEEDLDLKKLWNELMPFIERNSLPMR